MDKYQTLSAKRAIDLAVSAIALLVLSPVLLVIATLLLIAQGWPVLFVDVRAGLHERPFRILKFRTMSAVRGQSGDLLPDSQRISAIGRVLRRTSLDELPELVNILTGDMSLVGPRPLPMEYLPLYNAYQRRRHEVRPGLTGLAQIHGRNRLSWPERFAYDVQYVDRMSFWLDIQIALSTLAVVVTGRGVETEAGLTSERFTGNEDPGQTNSGRMLGSDLQPTSPR